MEQYFEQLDQTSLFWGFGPRELGELLRCLKAAKRAFSKDAVIRALGSSADTIGVVLAGGALVRRDDYDGNRTVVTRLGPSDVFGEVFCCAGLARYPVEVVAAQRSEVLLLDYKRILTTEGQSCKFRDRLVENMLRVVAQKTLGLSGRLDILSRRTTRDKLLAYLFAQSGGAREFSIELDRQQLADYLCVDRSAMSNELSKLTSEGVLRTEKKRFWLLGDAFYE